MRTLAALVALSALLASGVPVGASPRDAKVGAVRATFSRAGTKLRSEASLTAEVVATLAYRSRVRIEEVRQPWLRVSLPRETDGEEEKTPVAGWLRSFETVEPQALAGPRKPFGLKQDASARDTRHASLLLQQSTARKYASDHPELRKSYTQLDLMESKTRTLDPAASIEFIVEGGLGRKGRDYARPKLLPPARLARGGRPGSSRRLGGLLRRLGGGALSDGTGGGGNGVGNGSGIGEILTPTHTDVVSQVKTKFPPEQEYFLGRAVAASIIARYGIDRDRSRGAYVRAVGDAIVRLSSRLPANYGGYHFAVLDSDECMSVSAPGGFVFVARGAVDAAKTESQLAAVLCHELAHVTSKQLEKKLRRSPRFPVLITALAWEVESSDESDSAGVAQAMQTFTEQIIETLTAKDFLGSYGRADEFAADREATSNLFDVYYDHTALHAYLVGVAESGASGAGTPEPAVRAKALEQILQQFAPYQQGDRGAEAQLRRFAASLGRTERGRK